MHDSNAVGVGLADQVAVVTGAGQGVGRAIARALSQAGATVVCGARTQSDLDETVALISDVGQRAWAAAVDVTERLAVEHLVQDVLAETGRIDLLVNCAGSFAALDPVSETDPELWWQDVTTNLYGTFICTRAVLPGMIKRRSGTIINLSGGGAGEAAPYWSGYASSKAGVLRFTECVAAEVAPYDIHVYALNPGLVRTNMTESLMRQPRVAEYAPWFSAAMTQGVDVPPDDAGRLAVFLATVRDARLSGRVFAVSSDYASFAAQAQQIAQDDLYTLRLRRPRTV